MAPFAGRNKVLDRVVAVVVVPVINFGSGRTLAFEPVLAYRSPLQQFRAERFPFRAIGARRAVRAFLRIRMRRTARSEDETIAARVRANPFWLDRHPLGHEVEVGIGEVERAVAGERFLANLPNPDILVALRPETERRARRPGL